MAASPVFASFVVLALVPSAFAGADSQTVAEVPNLPFVEYVGPRGGLSFGVGPIRASRLHGLLSLVSASAKSVSVSVPVRVAQASPVMPGTRGCGLLQVQVPTMDPRLADINSNPLREDVRASLASDAFAALADSIRSAFEQSWDALEMDYGSLVILSGSLSNMLFDAMRRVDALEVQACNLEDLSSRVRPAVMNWNAICRGAVPDATYDWCIAEKQRLQPDVTALANGERGLISAVGEYNDRQIAPWEEKNDKALGLYAAWDASLRKLKSKVDSATSANQAECHNSVNVHFQRDKASGYEPPVIPNATDVSRSGAVAHLLRVTAAFHALNANSAWKLKGLGHATSDASLFLQTHSSPPAFERSFPFAPVDSGVMGYRLDVAVKGRYPCPEPIGMAGF